MLLPLSTFCCGCSLPAGVTVILLCHLVQCIVFIHATCCNLIYHYASFMESWRIELQLAYFAFCLIGVPLICSASLGVLHKTEANIRIYLWYLILCTIVNLAWIIYSIASQDLCMDSEGSFFNFLSTRFGTSFLCGVAHIISWFVIAIVVLVEVYVLWAVWSICEDIRAGSYGPNLSELIPSKEAAFKKATQDGGPYAGIVGLAHAKLPGPYPTGRYGAVDTVSGTVPAQGMFGSSKHETKYPPPMAATYY